MCSLSYGTLDPLFQDFAESFWQTVQICFGMFKPVGVVQYNPPLFKYVPHTLLGNTFMAYIPYLLLLLFKLLVMLLLFKLLLGVIMESYKRSAKKKMHSYNVLQEVKELAYLNFYYYYHHKLR